MVEFFNALYLNESGQANYSKVCLLRLCICKFSMLYPFPLSPPTSWSELQVWPQGALVKHVRGLFKAEGINVTAEPGNSLHARFYVSQSIVLPSFSRSFLSISLSVSSFVSVCSVYLCLSVCLSLSPSLSVRLSPLTLCHSITLFLFLPPPPFSLSLSLLSYKRPMLSFPLFQRQFHLHYLMLLLSISI